MKVLQFLLVSFIICGCHSQKMQEENCGLTPFKILSIAALDLSEDRSMVSSKNDEVLLSFFFYTEEDGKSQVYETVQWPTLVFDSSERFKILNLNLTKQGFKPNSSVMICLTEIDTDQSEAQCHQQLKELLETQGEKAFDKRSKVDALLNDNDLLGHLKLPKHACNALTSYNISGKHLTDPFHYRIEVRAE